MFCIYAIYFHYHGSISYRCIMILRLEAIFAIYIYDLIYDAEGIVSNA